MNPTNLDTFADYIREKGHANLNTEWVLWMLETIKNTGEHELNPRWLRATPVGFFTRHGVVGTSEPLMTNFTAEEIDDPESWKDIEDTPVEGSKEGK